MSFKLLIIKGAKPVAAACAVAVTAYGTLEWQKAKDALHISENETDMISLFDSIDTDHSGSIDKEELGKALNKAGIRVNRIALESMMQSADENHDGMISKEEWKHICDRLSGKAHHTTILVKENEHHELVGASKRV